MKKDIRFACDLLDIVMVVPRSGPLHEHYHAIAKKIAQLKKISQLFLLMRRSLSDTELSELSFWVYPAGSFIEKQIIEAPIIEISMNDCPFFQVVNEEKKHHCNIYYEPKLRDKLYRACFPVKTLTEKMYAFSFNDTSESPSAFLFIPENERNLITKNDIALLCRIFKQIYNNLSKLYSENVLIKDTLSHIAGELLKIAENQHQSTLVSQISDNIDKDVLQTFLNYCRKKMKAEKCALFLVDYQNRSLSLERISEEGGSLHYDKIPQIQSYDLEHYSPEKKRQGVTPWVLKRKKPFNARSFEELVNSSDDQHKGNWDNFIYGDEKGDSGNQARDNFQCVYMTPLLSGEKAIGVLKFENRTKDVELPYFDQSEEREIDIMGEMVANIVLSQRIERNRYEKALPDISKTMVTYFGLQIFYEKLLEECRKLLQADICSLFLVASNHVDLELKAIVGISDEKKKLLKDFKYENYKKSVGMTPWILQKNSAFNVRSYKDLVDLSQGRYKGRWDHIVYDGDTENRFTSLYSIPLKIGDEDIGVLRMENKKVLPFYFTDSDERLFDVIGRLIAVGVKYEQHQFVISMKRNSELGFLSSGIAHEFNNYLQSFRNKAALLKNKGDVKVRIIAGELDKQIDMAGQVIRNFQEIRTRKNMRTTFGLNELIEQIIKISSERFKNSNIEFISNIEDSLKITMNPAEIQTVIINLLKNAVDAVEGITDKEKYIHLDVTKKDKNLIIEVADSGGGIEPSVKEHMLAPYVTSKDSGMGMGLFWVSQIIDRNNGIIKPIKLNSLGGATFQVTLFNVVNN